MGISDFGFRRAEAEGGFRNADFGMRNAEGGGRRAEGGASRNIVKSD